MKVLEWLACVLLVGALIYGIGGFVSMTWNPASWVAASRFLLCFLSFVIGSIAFSFRC